MKTALVLMLVLAACSDREKPKDDREPERPRRVIEPPSKGVRAQPPFAIRSDGVGPYKLGDAVSKLLDQLPSGPRITQFSIPNIVHRDILRAEDDEILIGTEPQGKAMFVAVVGSEIARTEGGVHVGSTRLELTRALGTQLDEPDRVRDPDIVVTSGLKNVRAVVKDEHVIAFVVAPDERTKESASEACTRPKADRDNHQFGACLDVERLIRYDADKIENLAKDSEKAGPTWPVPNLVFAGALRNPADGRDDLAWITRSADAQSKTWTLYAARVNDAKLKNVIEPTVVFQLTAANARWIGADLRDVELYLELTSRADSIEVGGLLATRSGDKIRDIVVISPVTVARKRSKPTSHEPPDAGTSDASANERPAK